MQRQHTSQCRNRIQNRKIRKIRIGRETKKNTKRNEIMHCEIWISFDFIRLENNATSSRTFLFLLRSFVIYLFVKVFFSLLRKIKSMAISSRRRKQKQCLSISGTTSTKTMNDDDLEQSYLFAFNSEVNSILPFVSRTNSYPSSSSSSS